MTTTTKLERNQEEAREYLNKIIGAPYTWWTTDMVIVPDRAPAWAKNGAPPPPAEVRREGCFCAAVPTLARRAVGLRVPTLDDTRYDGGIVAYFGAADSAPRAFARKGFFNIHNREHPFDLKKARLPWTLVGRKYRNGSDQGHVAIVLPNGKVLQSTPDLGVHTERTLEQSHGDGYYEVMVFAKDWLLPLDYEESEDGRGDKEPDRDRESDKEEPDRPPADREVVLFTTRQLSEISGNTDLAALERHRDALVPEMRKAGITTPLRMAAFLGNVCQETDHLKTLREYDNAAGTYLKSKPYYPYFGRGYLQNTWKDAYERLSRVLGASLVRNPDLLAQNRSYAARAAVWFWRQHDLNSYADRGEFKKVCAIINTGSESGEPYHLAERLGFYDRAKRVFSGGAAGGASDRDDLRRKGLNSDRLPFINLAAVGQADETAAFVLAAEIRKAGIGVTVTNGARNVYALAKKIRPERLGYRQLWIMGGGALKACGDYGDLANWPVSRKTDYYDLAGENLTGTCRRAAELADEKAREGVGQGFLRRMGMAEPTDEAEPRLPARAPRGASDDPEPRGNGRRAREPADRGDRGKARRGRDEPDGPRPTERLADEDLEEIGREVIELIARIRGHNGRGKVSRTGAYEEED